MEWAMGPANTWKKMGDWLKALGESFLIKPKALVVFSAHWEEDVVTINNHSQPPLLFDYYGFPRHTYELEYAAPGSPELSSRVHELFEGANIPSKFDGERGFDHGVFVPLKLVFPDASIPIVQVSLKKGLDPSAHIEIGKALEPLRSEDVLLISSGMSYHNLSSFFRGSESSAHSSESFDQWLTKTTCNADWQERNLDLSVWDKAPAAREAHPREEHLIPLMVAAGAAGSSRGEQVFHDTVMGAKISGYQFG